MAAVSITYPPNTEDYKPNGNKVVISNSTFTRHHGNDGNCSSLYISHIKNAIFDNLTFVNNNCTGVTLVASEVTIRNVVNISNNMGIQGGAIQLLSDTVPYHDFSTFVMTSQAQLHMINNHAERYGGAIFSDITCESVTSCFFGVNISQTCLFFSGNGR